MYSQGKQKKVKIKKRDMHEVECTCFNVPALEKTKDKKKDEGRRGGEREETKEKPTAS